MGSLVILEVHGAEEGHLFTGTQSQSPFVFSLLLVGASSCTPTAAPFQETSAISVTYENLVRAEVDQYFRTRLTETGTGMFYHFHQFMPIDPPM